jgi:preprotein translocase subunit Sss1
VTSRIGAAVAVAAIVLLAGAVGYLITTFLFAFSGGQYRMVTVVNAATLIVIGLSALVAVIVWKQRSPGAAIGAAAIATGAAWTAALVAEWVVSFWLGAA